MYTYADIRHIHIEPTTRCNAECPMCARNSRGKTASNLRLTELSLADVKAILPTDFLAQIEGFDACGAYGDPAAAVELVEIVEYVRAASPDCHITVYSNGSLRKPVWWERLARALGEPAEVVFAIDGIGAINAIHRRGVRFEQVMDNAKAYIAAGGSARWEFLAFRHNEHQIEEARALSEEMGFAQFSLKKSGRFLEPAHDYVGEYEDHDNLYAFPIFDRKEQVVGYLEPARSPEYVNGTVSGFEQIVGRHGDLDALFSRTRIECRVEKTRSVFISAEGHAYPCCWTYVQATRPSICGMPRSADYQMVEMLDRTGGMDRIDAKQVGLRDAVESPLFDAVEESWSCGSVKDGKLRVCARACGQDFPVYDDQFAEPARLPKGLRARAENA